MNRVPRGLRARGARRSWWVVVVPALTACETQGPVPTAIDVTSDRSLVFTVPSQEARISAVVLDAGGAVVPQAIPTYSSSDRTTGSSTRTSVDYLRG